MLLGELGKATSVCGCEQEELEGHREGFSCAPSLGSQPRILPSSLLPEAPSQLKQRGRRRRIFDFVSAEASLLSKSQDGRPTVKGLYYYNCFARVKASG